MKTRAYRKQRLALATILLWIGFASACGNEPQEPEEGTTEVVRDKVYSDIVCPDGEIPWQFPNRGTALNSEEYTASADVAMKTDGQLATFSRIRIQEVTCGNAIDATRASKVLGNSCEGFRSCNATNVCQFNCGPGGSNSECKYSDATIKYTCGSNDLDANGDPKVYTATAKTGTAGTYGVTYPIDCTGIGDQLVTKGQRDGTIACIPAQCHGRARRNADMQCVVDDTKVEVVVEATIGEIKPAFETTDHFTKKIIAEAIKDKKIFAEPLPINATYNIPVTVKFANELVPEEVKFTAWLEDTHTGPSDTYNIFRCVPFAFTLKATDPHITQADGTKVYQKTIKTKFSEDCISIDPFKEMQAHVEEVDPGTLGFRPSLYVEFNNVFQNLHLSYDMEGRSVWHKGLNLKTASQLGDSTPECTPNPMGMFYERLDDNYNHSAYYEQRRVTTYKPPGDGKLFFSYAYADRSEIGTVDIVARNEPVIRVFSNRRTTMTFDLSWYVSNMDRNHRFNLENPKTRMIYGENRKYINSPRADVYLVPAGLTVAQREAITPLHIGKVDLSDGNNNGKIEGADDGITQSASLVFPADVKQKMVRDASSPHFIEGKSRSFDLFYCINAWDGLLKRDAYTTGWVGNYNYFRNEVRLMSEPLQDSTGKLYGLVDSYDLAHDVRRQEEGQPRREAYWTGPFSRVWSLELENRSMHNPYATPFKYRGCRTAKVPVVVYVDRFKTPVEPAERVTADIPTSARIHTDFADGQESGDTSMSGSNDTGLEETCPNMDSSDIYCSNTSNSGGRSSGEGGRPALDATTTIERSPPQADAKYDTVALKVRAQLAEFMALDLSEAPGTPGVSRQLEFNIAPNWDNIAELLNGGDPSPNTEWKEGRFGGRDGLGYSIGYNLMFNIGPVPVFVTISFAVGASIGLTITLDLGPPDGEEYQCTGESEDCFLIENTATSFADAVEACSDAGGRLAEMKDEDEAADLIAALKEEGIDSAWIGAQIAYEKDNRISEYRWLSDSTPFATDENGGAVRYLDNIEIKNERGLATFGESPAAVFLNPNAEELGATRIDQGAGLPYVCTLPYADEEAYFGWSVALKIGAGAGVGLQGCTPSPFVGFCLSANLAIIGAEVAPTVGQSFRWLLRNGEAFARNGTLSFSIPFTLTLFAGDVRAALKIALLFVDLSIEWVIHAFDGLKLLEIDLYKVEFPVLEDY